MQQQQFRLHQRLKNCYKKKVSKLGLGLTPACQTLIERMINNGIERMRTQGAMEREEQIWFAEQNLSQYLNKLAHEAQARGTFPLVDDRAVDKVLKEQCPIWPYC